MLALKKKRELQKKAAEEAAKAEAANPTVSAPADGADGAAAEGGSGQVSLFGIGGQKKTKKGESSGTRKTPGEIRIQKGVSYYCNLYLVLFRKLVPDFLPTLSHNSLDCTTLQNVCHGRYRNFVMGDITIRSK